MMCFVIVSEEKKYLEINGEGELIWHEKSDIHNATMYKYRTEAAKMLFTIIERGIKIKGTVRKIKL